jgi:hypothetical protein
MRSVMFNLLLAECHYAECHYSECRGTQFLDMFQIKLASLPHDRLHSGRLLALSGNNRLGRK